MTEGQPLVEPMTQDPYLSDFFGSGMSREPYKSLGLFAFSFVLVGSPQILKQRLLPVSEPV